MRDRFFYPLFVLVIVGILALALSPGQENKRTQVDPAQGYELTGSDLETLTAAPGTLLSFETGQDGTLSYAILAANLPRKMAVLSAGVFGTLGTEYEAYFVGKTLEITVVARQDEAHPLAQFDVGYFTTGAGDSGWKPFVLTPEFQAYTFSFTPKKSAVAGNDYFGIWPGRDGDSQVMHVQRMTIKIIQP